MATVNSWSQTLESLSHPAALYYDDDLELVHNQAWADITGEVVQQGRRQRYILPEHTVTALETVLHGGRAPGALQCFDFVQTLQDGVEYDVLLSQLPGLDNDMTGVIVQLFPRVYQEWSTDDRIRRKNEQVNDSQSETVNKNNDGMCPSIVDRFAQQLADMLPVGIVILNDNGRPISINRRFHELHPYSKEEDFDCWLQCIHPDDHDRVTSAYHKAIKFKCALRIEYRVRGQQENLWCLLLLNPLSHIDLWHADIRPQCGFICTVVDIMAEKSAELAQAKAAKEAKEQKQQQEQFIDMISHEIRNPLSAILHCTEDIMDAVKDKKPADQDMEEIVQATETINLCLVHQKKVVDDVLSFSKLDASMLCLSPQIIRPKVELPISLKMFKPELRKQDIQFEYRLDYSYVDYSIDWTMADLTRICQVVINLFSNAIKFTTKRSGEKKITLSMGASLERPPSYPPNVVFFNSEPAALRLDATNRPEWGKGEETYIMVAVSDTGIGISDESQRKLFSRFNQGTPQTEVDYGGSGLGLSVSRKLCHLHGGEIGVSSKKGQGSTFGFFFRVRRSAPPSDHEVGQKDDVAISELCEQIGALGHETFGPGEEQKKNAESSMEPKVTRSLDVMPNAKDDERTSHTAGIVYHNTKSDDSKFDYAGGKSEDKRKKQPSPLSHAGRGHILLVEDNVINQRLLSRKLKSVGFDVSEADDGREALGIVQKGGFACILMDKEMPVMNGNEATKRIRQLENKEIASIPILGITANVRAEQQTQMEKAGMNGVIHKPYKTEDLVKRITQLVEKAPR